QLTDRTTVAKVALTGLSSEKPFITIGFSEKVRKMEVEKFCGTNLARPEQYCWVGVSQLVSHQLVSSLYPLPLP
ncbi:MAG: hypothetical protein ACO37F_07710, partial [Pirellulales bacterium]